MYEIIFYKDKSGCEPVYQYIEELAKKNDKDSRIKLNKINDYFQALCEYGTRIGKPYVDHIEGDIWELRPIRDRVLFAVWSNGRFVLLHQFVKQTQKTPKREIEQAKREWADFLERSE